MGTEAVDGFGRERDQAAASQDLGGARDRDRFRRLRIDDEDFSLHGDSSAPSSENARAGTPSHAPAPGSRLRLPRSAFQGHFTQDKIVPSPSPDYVELRPEDQVLVVLAIVQPEVGQLAIEQLRLHLLREEGDEVGRSLRQSQDHRHAPHRLRLIVDSVHLVELLNLFDPRLLQVLQVGEDEELVGVVRNRYVAAQAVNLAEVVEAVACAEGQVLAELPLLAPVEGSRSGALAPARALVRASILAAVPSAALPDARVDVAAQFIADVTVQLEEGLGRTRGTHLEELCDVRVVVDLFL